MEKFKLSLWRKIPHACTKPCVFVSGEFLRVIQLSASCLGCVICCGRCATADEELANRASRADQKKGPKSGPARPQGREKNHAEGGGAKGPAWRGNGASSADRTNRTRRSAADHHDDLMDDLPEPGGAGTAGAEPELGAPPGAADALAGGPPGADTPAPEAPEAGATPEPPEDGGLLAAPPAKRDDMGKQTKREGGKTKTTTAKSHGWYEPRSNKPGGDRRKSTGPMQKNMKRAASPEFGTYRKTLPGASELSQLVKGTGVYESKLTIYSKEEEEKLLKSQEELKVLFENIDLEKRKEKNETEAQ